jgi:mannose-1-phosphate guanylyltransferase
MTYSLDQPPLYAVVMAGGAGTRFWPLSRRSRPKQLLPFAQGRSLLAAAVDRLTPLVPPSHTLVVTSAEVADAVRTELPQLARDSVLAEPAGRDTAACVGWVAWRLARAAPGSVMVVVPADHVIPDGAALRSALAVAASTACSRGGLVTLAVRPTRAETGFGYLELGEVVDAAVEPKVRTVRRFIEKPTREHAEEFVRAGTFAWNSGMFAWTVEAIKSAIEQHLPALASGLDRMMDDVEAVGEDEALRRHYPGLPRVSVDRGVMEKAQTVWAVDVAFEWTDVGSWVGLAAVLPQAPGGAVLGDVIALDSDDSVLVSDGPLLAAVGIHDVVVVATRDAVLVVPKDDAQRVKDLVTRLQQQGRDDVL